MLRFSRSDCLCLTGVVVLKVFWAAVEANVSPSLAGKYQCLTNTDIIICISVWNNALHSCCMGTATLGGGGGGGSYGEGRWRKRRRSRRSRRSRLAHCFFACSSSSRQPGSLFKPEHTGCLTRGWKLKGSADFPNHCFTVGRHSGRKIAPLYPFNRRQAQALLMANMMGKWAVRLWWKMCSDLVLKLMSQHNCVEVGWIFSSYQFKTVTTAWIAWFKESGEGSCLLSAVWLLKLLLVLVMKFWSQVRNTWPANTLNSPIQQKVISLSLLCAS